MIDDRIQPKKPIHTRLLSTRALWQALSLVLGVGLMIFILRQIDLAVFLQKVRSMPTLNLLGAFAAYLLLNVLRALRFRAFIPEPRPAIGEMLPIVLYHNFLTRFLPFKTGEISYVIMLNRQLKQPLSEGVSSLVSARLFELALVLLGGIFGLVSLQAQTGQQQTTLVLVFGTVTLAYAVALYRAGSLLRLAARVWAWLITPRLLRRFPNWRGEDKLRVMAGQFERIHDLRLLLWVVVLSFGTFSLSTAFQLILLRGLGLTLPFGALLSIICIKALAGAVPMATSGFGMIEGSWTFGLVVIGGVDLGEAAAMGLFLHIAQLTLSALSGVIGWLLLGFRPRKHRFSSETVKE